MAVEVISNGLKPDQSVVRAIGRARRHLGSMIGNEYFILAQNVTGVGRRKGRFVCGSMSDKEKAIATVKQMIEQGPKDSSGEPHRTFSLFTRRGFIVPLEEN